MLPAISFYKYNNQNNNSNKVSFKAHPDFIRLAKSYDVKASSFFRRGSFYGSPSEQFSDIVDVFRTIFQKGDASKKKVLIAGIGDSQEPFSYLAVIKSLIKDKQLKDVVDLQIVDLQTKPTLEALKQNAFFDLSSLPDFAPDSFIKTVENSPFQSGYGYRVNDEILDFVADTYENVQKSQWERRLQEALPEYPSDNFDIVSINNTLGYIKQDDVRYSAIQNVLKTLKMDGVFITDPFRQSWLKKAGVFDSFNEIRTSRLGDVEPIEGSETGIYKKISNKITPPEEMI